VKTIKRKIPVFLLMLVFVLSIVFMLPGMLLGQEEDEAEMEEAEEPEPEPEPETMEFDVTYPEIQAELGSTYEFEFKVVYDMGTDPFGLEEDESEKIFDIIVEYPETWFAAATPQYQTETEITAVKLSNAEEQTLRVVAVPLVKLEPGEYDISVTLKSTIEDDPLEGTVGFKAIITSTYEMGLSTKTGRLSTDVTSGQDNHYKLILKNNGSANLENITISSTDEPEGWDIEFDTDEIEILEAGEEKEIDANIKPADKAIAGDYMIGISAKSDNAEDDIELRITVETPTIWGIIGIGIIVVVIVAVAIVFARLGRR
jgi:uncharacterized membrane protein